MRITNVEDVRPGHYLTNIPGKQGKQNRLFYKITATKTFRFIDDKTVSEFIVEDMFKTHKTDEFIDDLFSLEYNDEVYTTLDELISLYPECLI